MGRRFETMIVVLAIGIGATLAGDGCRRGGGGGDECDCDDDGVCCEDCGLDDPDCVGPTTDGDADTETDSDSEGSGVCEPGARRMCACEAGGEGVQSCEPDGTGWSACACGPADADADVDSDVDADTDVDVDTDVDADSDADMVDCDDDGWCNPACGGDDPDCGPVCVSDRSCNLDCPIGTDPDCACGRADQRCCTEEPGCMTDLLCVSTGTTGELCLSSCTPSICSYGTSPGACLPYEGPYDGLCARTDVASTPATCTAGETGCETEYGETTNTLCAATSGAATYCFERCSIAATGCDEVHLCMPLTGRSDGACFAF